MQGRFSLRPPINHFRRQPAEHTSYQHQRGSRGTAADSDKDKELSQKTIRIWHIVIPGFLQNEGKPVGMVQLWRDLHQAHAWPDTCVELREWNSDWNALAELIWRYRGEGAPRIAIYGYSWGGMSAVFLARQLQRRGIGVKWMVLSDPVYRHSYPLGNWRTLVPWKEIVVPRTVDRVEWFRQRRSWPRGHDLVKAGPLTHLGPAWEEQNCDHRHMDDLPVFQNRCREVAKIT